MSGWATITVETDEEDSAEELAKALGDAQDGHANRVDVRNGTRVEALVGGYDGNSIALGVLKDNAGLWDEAVVMSCNDTSDSGSGSVYESDGTSVEKTDSASGVEGARGHDAAQALATTEIGRPYMR